VVDEKNSDPVMLDFWCENKKHWALLVVTIMHELVLILIMTLMKISIRGEALTKIGKGHTLQCLT